MTSAAITVVVNTIQSTTIAAHERWSYASAAAEDRELRSPQRGDLDVIFKKLFY